MKYKCDNPKCGAEFDEPGTYKEYHNELEGNPYELLCCCPECGCEDYREIDEEPEEFEDDEADTESFDYLVQVRFKAYYTRSLSNAYYYAPTKEDADAIVDKYMKGKRTSHRVKLCRIYELRETKEADNDNKGMAK